MEQNDSKTELDHEVQTLVPEFSPRKKIKVKVDGNKKRKLEHRRKVMQVREEDVEIMAHRILGTLASGYSNVTSRSAWMSKMVQRYNLPCWSNDKNKIFWNHLLATREIFRKAENELNALYKKPNNYFGKIIIEKSEKKRLEKRQNDLEKKKIAKLKKEQQRLLEKEEEEPVMEEDVVVDLSAIMSEEYAEGEKPPFEIKEDDDFLF